MIYRFCDHNKSLFSPADAESRSENWKRYSSASRVRLKYFTFKILGQEFLNVIKFAGTHVILWGEIEGLDRKIRIKLKQ